MQNCEHSIYSHALNYWSPSTAKGSGGVTPVTPGKFLKLYIAVDDFWCIFMDQKVVFFYEFTVLGGVWCTIGLGAKQASSSCNHCFESPIYSYMPWPGLALANPLTIATVCHNVFGPPTHNYLTMNIPSSSNWYKIMVHIILG